MLAESVARPAPANLGHPFMAAQGAIGRPTRVNLSATTDLANTWEYECGIAAFFSQEERLTSALRRFQEMLSEESAQLRDQPEAIRSAFPAISPEALTRPFEEMAPHVASLAESLRREMNRLRFQLEGERLREEFDVLTDEWHAATDHLSVIWQQAIHPAFQAIIGMGDAAVPHVLRHIKQGRDPSWFWALRAIARNRDAPTGITDRNEAIAAWERWAQERDLL